MRVPGMKALLQLGALAFASSAVADGAPLETSRLSYVPANWSGVFVGVQGGGMWADTGWTFPIDSYFTLPDGNRSISQDATGGSVGGHIALNHQIGAFVIGAELAINGAFFDAKRTGGFTPLFPNDTFETSIEDYGTLTARLGYAHRDLLFYVDGGYAAGHVALTAVSGPPGGGVIGEVKQRLNGWTAGAGVDWMLAHNVSVGVAYDYIQLAGETTATQTTGTPSNDPFIVSTHNIDLHAVTARLSIKLDGPQPADTPLK